MALYRQFLDFLQLLQSLVNLYYKFLRRNLSVLLALCVPYLLPLKIERPTQNGASFNDVIPNKKAERILNEQDRNAERPKSISEWITSIADIEREYDIDPHAFAKTLGSNGYDKILKAGISVASGYNRREYVTRSYANTQQPSGIALLEGVQKTYKAKSGKLSLKSDDIGYHAGDLGKAEPRSSMSGSRDTGHFGTGTHFVGNKPE